MPIDAQFPSVEDEFETYKHHIAPDSLTTSIAPMGYPRNPGLSTDVVNTDIQPFETPFRQQNLQPKETPGFWKSAAHEFKELEVVAHGIDYGIDKYNMAHPEGASTEEGHQNPLQGITPPNWTPWLPDSFIGYDQKYWSYLGQSDNPDDLQARQQHVTNLMKQEEYYSDGSFWGKIAGGVAGIATDIPLFMLIPMAGAVRYAEFAPQIINNVIRQAPGIAVGSIAYTAAIDATTTGKTMSDFAWDAAVNTIGGVFLTAGAAGFGHLVNGGELYSARHALKMNFQDINAVHIVDKEGRIAGQRAVPGVNSSANAMEVTRAQEFLDSRFARVGLFKIPFIGPGVEKLAGNSLFGSPIVRGKTSKWLTTNALTNRLADSSIEVVGDARGVARPPNYESMLFEFRKSGILMNQKIEGYRNIANGMGGEGLVAGAKRLKQRMTEGQMFNKDQWGEKVMTHLFSGEDSEIPQVNELVRDLNKYYEDILTTYQKAHGLDVKALPVRTAVNYLTRRYDLDYMTVNEGQWNDMCLNWFRHADNIIEEAQRPLNEATGRVKDIERLILNGVDVDANREALRAAKRIKARENRELKQQLRDNEDLQIHLDERYTMSEQDEKALKVALKPWKDAQKSFKAKKSELSKAKEMLNREQGKFTTGEPIIGEASKAPKDYESIKAKISQHEKDISRLEKEVVAAEEEQYKRHQALMNEVSEGKINSNMYIKNPETGHIKFKNPNERPKFRKTFYELHGEDAQGEMMNQAKGYYNSITGTDADRLAGQMMDTIHGSVTGNPMKERSFLIPDQWLLDNNFLSKDLERNTMIYALTLGKKTSMQNALKGFGVSRDGVHGVADEYLKEFEKKKAAVAQLPKEKADRAIQKLAREYKSEVKFSQAIFKIAGGNYAKTTENETVRHYTNALRSLAASTRLGNVPILQLPDLANHALRWGPWQFFRDGLLPAITTMNGMLKTKNALQYKEAASTAGLCLEHTLHSKVDQLWNYSTQSSETVAGKVSNGMNWVAGKASTLSGANSIENLNQAMAANISQSNLMTSMFKFQQGTLSKKEARALAKFGVDPNVWSKRFVDSFERADGIKRKTGGYLSDYSNWEDIEARNMFAQTIRKSVSETIIKRGMFDSPLWSNDPALGLIFTFTGWMYAALNRFTIPMLQRPFDTNLIGGTFVAVGLGSLVDPLRAWTRGEGFSMDDDHWFAHAISNAAPYAPLYNTAMKVGALTSNEHINSLKNDRHRRLSVAGELGGASMGLIEVYTKAAMMVGSGKFNQKDFKNLLNAIPGMEMWYLNDAKNQWMDSMLGNLPKNAESAEGYGG